MDGCREFSQGTQPQRPVTASRSGTASSQGRSRRLANKNALVLRPHVRLALRARTRRAERLFVVLPLAQGFVNCCTCFKLHRSGIECTNEQYLSTRRRCLYPRRSPAGSVGGRHAAGGLSVAGGRLLVKRYDLNNLLVAHQAATFMWRARGFSMIERHRRRRLAGVQPGFSAQAWRHRGGRGQWRLYGQAALEARRHGAAALGQPDFCAHHVSGRPDHDDLRRGHGQHQALQVERQHPCSRSSTATTSM